MRARLPGAEEATGRKGDFRESWRNRRMHPRGPQWAWEAKNRGPAGVSPPEHCAYSRRTFAAKEVALAQPGSWCLLAGAWP